MDVSIILVNYNTKDLICACIESIYNHTKALEYEIIVSDNNSLDDSVSTLRRMYPSVIIIENKKNLGFGAANNRGLSVAKGKYIFYLNSDTYLKNNAIKMFYDYFEKHQSENIGALGAILINEKDEKLISYGRFPTLKRDITSVISCFLKSVGIRKDTKVQRNNSYIGNVDFIIGADLFVKNNEFAKFDEHFFMYFEETDLQFQMNKIGLSRIIIEGPKIVHLEGGSSGMKTKKYSFEKLTSCYYWISCVKYHKKNDEKILLLRFFIFVIKFIYSLSKNRKNYSYVTENLSKIEGLK